VDSITNRTAVYGSVRTVVWEGWRSDPSPYPDRVVLYAKLGKPRCFMTLERSYLHAGISAHAANGPIFRTPYPSPLHGNVSENQWSGAGRGSFNQSSYYRRVKTSSRWSARARHGG